MNERLLQFIWQHQYFNRNNLITEQGDILEIISPGKWNYNQGPDFSEAKIRAGLTIWAGNIELHVHASDWIKHNHNQDINYRNIILHVVWINDLKQDASPLDHMPMLELESRVSKFVLKRFEELMKHELFVPCEAHISDIHSSIWDTWKKKLIMERLERKSSYVLKQLRQSQFHWEESFWWMLAKNFGGKLNGEAFELVAKSIPLKLLAKHKNQVHQIESMLFGQALMLEQVFTEDYPLMLQKEYRFLRSKYKLQQPFISVKFLRMRPSGFPGLRLAQLAVLIHQSTHLFSKIKETDSPSKAKELLQVKANDYWHYHYRFDEPCRYKEKPVGADMINSILINTVIPMLYCFAVQQKQPLFKEKAIDWLCNMPAEKNRITSSWNALGIEVVKSYDSQALIELKTHYCDLKKCLDCVIGKELLGYNINNAEQS